MPNQNQPSPTHASFSDTTHVSIQAITFPGFYNSIFDGDSLTESLIYLWKEDHDYEPYNAVHPGHTVDPDNDLILNYEEYRKAVADAYADAYLSAITEGLKLPPNIPLALSSIYIDSPREYNFRTDRLYLECTVPSRRALCDHLLHLLSSDPDCRRYVARCISENHRSRSGFMSFMSDDIAEWEEIIALNDPEDDHYLSYLIAYICLANDTLSAASDECTVGALAEIVYDQTYEAAELIPATDAAKERFDHFYAVEARKLAHDKWLASLPVLPHVLDGLD